MNEDINIKPISQISDFLIQDNSNEAVFCENCHTPLNESSIRYVNGIGFCSTHCETIYLNKIKFGSQISDALDFYIPPLYRDSNFNIIKQSLKFPQNFDRVIEWKPNPKGLAIIGKTGSAKTRTLCILIKNLIEKYLVGITSSLKVFYAGELERAIISSFKKASEYDVLMRKLESCDLLIIDDFGKEKFTERYEVSVFQIFEKRFANLKPIIFTTNYRGEEFKARFSDMANYEPFSRRINEFMERINFSKKD